MKQQQEVKLYDKLVQNDVLTPIRELLDSGGLQLKIDGTIHLGDTITHQRLWLHNKFDPLRANCGKWLRIYFAQYDFHPKACQGCWKIVLPLDTLGDLMVIHQFQAKNDLPAKCGIELRDYAFRKGLYCAFWYVPLGVSEAEALGYLESIRTQLSETRWKQTIFLKRGCTEIEHRYGASSQWHKNPRGNEALEVYLDQIFVDSPTRDKECFLMIPHVVRQWIEHARNIGDPTVESFYVSTGLPKIDHYSNSTHVPCPLKGQQEIRENGNTSEQETEYSKNYNRSQDAKETLGGIIERLS